ncbi:hypothetical protein SLEP1_g53927 [Rubroshorea leprosula]|uniref:Uncharacterized protein n=1 Tax=Rubroshorea leprosula TaxID=152421 RepID=A0AAV5MD84_9ROSI|nr:hypothetical protein SLEP1_g53927 [Rubroshorea leprosula]
MRWAERLAFFAIAVNMVAYLVFVMHESLPTAAPHVTNWIGAAYVLTLLGAFLADAYFGRFMTIIVFSCIYAVPPSAAMHGQALHKSNRPPNQFPLLCTGVYSPWNWRNQAVRLLSLRGSIRRRRSQRSPEEVRILKLGFEFLPVSWFSLSSAWLPEHLSTGTGSPFTRFFQVIVAAERNHFRGVEVRNEADLYKGDTTESDISGARKIAHTNQYKFLDKAAVRTESADLETNMKNRWRTCTVTQVEEFKCFLRILLDDCPLNLIRPTLHLLRRPSHHHGPKARPQFHNSGRLCSRFQRR